MAWLEGRRVSEYIWLIQAVGLTVKSSLRAGYLSTESIRPMG
jgi:hypothetical protein